jgi:hypothetical protein
MFAAEPLAEHRFSERIELDRDGDARRLHKPTVPGTDVISQNVDHGWLAEGPEMMRSAC